MNLRMLSALMLDIPVAGIFAELGFQPGNVAQLLLWM